MTHADALRAELSRAARTLGAPDDVSPILERPRDPSFGDWATNLAMTLAKPLGKKPRDIAEALIAAMDKASVGVTAAEIAGPGFLNFRLDPGFQARGLLTILESPDTFGRLDIGHGERVVVEFVSANPTGPLHVGHGRQAALGDAISTLLEYTGWKVDREFYYNDAGAQIANLAKSTQAQVRAIGGAPLEIPEGGYHGDYIREIAERYVVDHPEDAACDDLAAMQAFAVAALRHEQDLDMQAFGVKFDTYYLESSLYTDGSVNKTVDGLKQSGHTYEEEGALFLRTTDFGDDKDRVMKKSAAKGGDYTYFVPDVAYHVTKWDRGYHRAINVQGADHHSTITRVRAGLQALAIGIPKGYPDYVLHQMVTVMKGGEEVKISKRAGSYVTVRDLIDEVGRDAVRYFYLMRKGDSQLVFDVDLARSQSEENPVYYVQMAHARMCGIFRVGEIDATTVTGEGVDLGVLTEPAEQELVKQLLDFPATVKGAADTLEPHRIAAWLLETARAGHTWYHKHHVLGEPEAITRARLVLARATQLGIAAGLRILGLSAPERM
ncbi:arginine--tRNA ligase [Gemmatimonas groenlandica]|uniref:Arginine--tRNA ligase n=1 Tax=Gemmatimonas groenlandica TaxID=2732249 RepID=A0A6M4INC3_9BACT|nr:arginine--tRNA ligase [Gemmatimonas groenlandica]QJR35259.1 arginine--tRNA ligase [Gemmatimonas groenlandica]